ncbi:hypothetical protein FS749_001054 [Ceratobasidium sp. UAMH 11750]|nr:hypothetical protein FS749_001054 [Ceratobasidium sp. UAMH 11750]
MPPRNTGTVLGLPVPDIPVDIDTPRASRALKRPTNVDSSEDSNSQSIPPRKIKKTASSTASTGPTASGPAPEVPKALKGKKSAAQTLGSNTEGGTSANTTTTAITHGTPDPTSLPAQPTAPTKASKKKKKNVAPAGDAAGDVEMDVLEPESIAIGGSLVPPSPAKKKSRTKKTPAATALGAPAALPTNPSSAVPVPTNTLNTAGGSASVNTTVGSKSSVADGPGTNSGKGTGRVKIASALAQKVHEQEAQKRLEKEAKAQRKKEKAQKAAIMESPEDTAAFVEAGNASNHIPSANSNIKISVPEVPVTTGGLQRVQKGSANKLIVQRITQRLMSSTPPLSSTSASGSEAPGTVSSSRAPSTSRSHKASRTPSVSLPPSHSVSVTPSTRSTPAPMFPGVARAMSSQPPTCPPSPSPSELVTLADHLDGVDAEFAPLLPVYDPLPPPLRQPQRLKPVPHKDVTKLAVAERREYLKECKFGVKDLTQDDQAIVSSVISRLEALVLTVDCFPSEADTRQLILVANAWGCRKHNLGNLDVEVGGPYEDLLLSRIPQMRSGIIEYTTSKVPEVYKIQTLSLSQEIIQYNKDIVKYWTTDGNFTCPPDDFGALYERSVLEDVLKYAFFQKQNSVGVIHRDLFSTIPIGAIATVASGLEKSLSEYETGVRVRQQFSRSGHRNTWVGHVAALCAIIKGPHGGRLINHLRELGQKLLRPFPQVSDSLNTMVVPKIPSIASRYGQAIAAPPPPQLPSSAPTPQSTQLEVDKPKAKPKVKPKVKPKPGLPPAAALAPVPVAVPLSPKAPIELDSDTSEPEMDAGLGLDQDAMADIGNPDAWARTIQAESTPMAQYDALHEMLGGESSDGEGDPPGPAYTAPEESEHEAEGESEGESAGEGVSGAGEVAAKQGGEEPGCEDSSESSESSDEE